MEDLVDQLRELVSLPVRGDQVGRLRNGMRWVLGVEVDGDLEGATGRSGGRGGVSRGCHCDGAFLVWYAREHNERECKEKAKRDGFKSQ